MTAAAVFGQLEALSDPGRALVSQRYFRTGKGEYGEGDRFLSIRMPQLRSLAGDCRHLALEETLLLLRNPWHEARMLALLLLVDRFGRSGTAGQKLIFTRYLAHSAWINNWDLVDASAHHIVGCWLEPRSRRPLFRLAASTSLWERRIAIISTLHFIRGNQFDTTLELVALLMQDSHDLIHKACGWMLRETGRRDAAQLSAFLDRHAAAMPRTMLRYATEKMSPAQQRHYRALKQLSRAGVKEEVRHG